MNDYYLYAPLHKKKGSLTTAPYWWTKHLLYYIHFTTTLENYSLLSSTMFLPSHFYTEG